MENRAVDSVVVEVSVVLAAMLLSAAGVVVVRRHADVEWLEHHHEIAGYFVTIIGTLYAVLLAFAVFAVWNDFKQASSNLEEEANRIGDLSRMAKGLSEPLRENVRTALAAYVRSVLEDEFPAMAEGRDSPHTWQAASNLWNVYRSGAPGDDKSRFYYEESVKPPKNSRHGAMTGKESQSAIVAHLNQPLHRLFVIETRFVVARSA
jgi:hypothetical protein